MATLKTQVDNLIGAGLGSTLYDNWLISGAHAIVDILSDVDMERHSTSASIGVSGLAVSGYRIFKIIVDGYTALRRDTGMTSQVVSSNSFYKASRLTPAYIITIGTLKCYNGTVYATGSSNTVVTKNEEGINYSANDVITLTNGMTITVLSVDAGTVDTFSVLSYGSTVVGGTDIGQTSVAPTGGTGATFDIVVNASGTLYGILYPVAIDSSTDSDFTGVPENMHYAIILFTAIQGRLKQLSDASDDMETLIAATTATVTGLVTSSIVATAAIDTETEPITEITTALAAIAVALTTNEDIELAQGYMQEVQTRVGDFKAKVDQNRSVFEANIQKDKILFDGDLQKAKAEFDSTVQRIQTELSTLQTKIATYNVKVQSYSIGLQHMRIEYRNLINLYSGKLPSATDREKQQNEQ